MNKMKKAQFDIDDIFAVLAWMIIVTFFLIILDVGSCNKGFSEANIKSEREKTILATRTLLNYFNTELDYNNKKVKMGDLISELYTTQDASKKDEIQSILIEKTKELLGKEECWTIKVLTEPRVEVESDKCKEIEPLHVMESQVGVTVKIPNSVENLEVEYQEYLFRLKEIGGI